MYQSQQFQTSGFRGNQLGQNTYLSADSPFPSGAGAQNVASQYRGIQRPFQPTGYVSSVYGQNLNQSQAGFTSAGAQSYHTANYRGNQPGHDSYLRSDSSQPSQSQFGIGATGTGYGQVAPSNFGASAFSNVPQGLGVAGTSAASSSFGGAGLGTSAMGASSLGASGISSFNQNQFVSPESFHTANYRGNQPGHDNYLRSDSSQPSQSQFATGLSSTANFGAGGSRGF